MTCTIAPFVLVVSLIAVSTDASDVVSVIKRNRSGAANQQLGVPLAGKFSATNVTVAALIGAAYGGALPLDATHITGLPAWATSERFDVEAKAEDAEPTEDSEDDHIISVAFAMVRTMLSERFHLRTHDTVREEPIYALVVARGGIRSGLKPTSRDCDAIAKAGPFSGPPPGTDPTAWAPCGVRVRRGEVVSAGGTLEQLARHLAPVPSIGRQVVDRTGIPGRFDFTFQWTPPESVPSDRTGTATAAETGPSLFTALQEQLGVRLDAARGPVRVLVVDHVERPTSN